MADTSNPDNSGDSPGSISSDVNKPSVAESSASTPAASGSSSQPQKRVRTSRPKVKTGCSVCKQRRIKCDEKRPSCTQCVRARKDCTGYPPPSRHALPLEGIRIAPKPAIAAHPPPLQAQAPGHIPGQASGQPQLAISPNLTRQETVLLPRRINRRHQPQHQGALVRREGSGSRGPSPAQYQPFLGVSFSPMEGLYFELFRTETLSGLSGLFDSSSWRQRVLQDCHGDAAIRHSAIALGALFKTLEQSSKTPSPTDGSHDRLADAVKTHWQVAVQEYSMACNAIMSPDAQSQQSWQRTRLLVSTLLGTFDAFIGDYKQAIVQIQNGLSLMERLWAEEDQDQTGQSSDAIEDDLAVVFTRLAISAKSYDLAFHFPEPYVIHLTPDAKDRPQSAQPRKKTPFSDPVLSDHNFSTLREARLSHEGMLDRGLRFLERLQVAQNHSQGFFPDTWKQYGGAFVQEMDAWEAAFRSLFDSRLEDPNLSFKDRSLIATLKMEHLNSRILFLSLFSSTESGFDVFIPQFANIIELAREVVAHDESQAASAAHCLFSPSQHGQQCPHQRYDDPPSVTAGGYAAYHLKPSFTADLGIVPPLFMVATKCREPTLRRQAIQLLRSSARREGMWDSELVARIGQFIMDIEEIPDLYQEHRGGDGGPLRVDTSFGSSMSAGGYGDPFGMGGSGYHQFRGHQEQQGGLLSEPSHVVPEQRRVMIHAVDFDLRSRTADLTVGMRGLKLEDRHDPRRKVTHISW